MTDDLETPEDVPVADDDLLVLAGEFATPTQADWLAAADKVLRGRRFEDVLQSTTTDGIVVEPLYTRDAEPADLAQYPGRGSGRRASNVAATLTGWDIRQRVGIGEDLQAANDAVLTDLQRGVTSVELDAPSLDADRLRRTLDGVFLDLAPVALRTSDDGVGAARHLLALVDDAEIATAQYVADLGCDPIGALARRGSLGRPIDEAMQRVAGLAAELTSTHPLVRVVRADGTTFAEAGASPAVELAAVVSAGVAYLRAFADAGLGSDTGLDKVLLTLSVGTDQFGDICKLRALRVLWARVAEVLGVHDHPATVQAVTFDSVLTSRDPWVNMLRTTIGCFAAAVGGADVITVTPFDAQLGVPDPLGRRVARNTQLALMEETQLHRVTDPGGGSWYIERLTDELADRAWVEFQALEAAGGVLAALRSGELQRRIGLQWEQQQHRVATRDRPITGVSEFANLDEELPVRPPSAPRPPVAESLDVTPLEPRRLASGFEALRARATTADSEPAVFLANLGPVATHTARSSWAKNFFEAGGIRTLGNDGFDDDEALVQGFRSSGARLAVLCSSDALYEQRAVSAAAALVQAGAARVYLAGDPGDQRPTYEAAGIEGFVHVGVDVLELLAEAHDVLASTEGAQE